MSFKKTDKIIDELEARLFIVEGEVTDLLTRETLENINVNYQQTTGAIAIGSALVEHIGNSALASFVASDEGIDVSVFALELTDIHGNKHYFKGCFPEVTFKIGNQVRIIAQPKLPSYAWVNAIVGIENNYIWTSQQIIKGRMSYRLWGIKFGGILGFICICIFIFILLFLENGIEIIADKYGILMFSGFVLLCLLMGWKVGSSFDEQSIELEAILRKLDFYKPSMVSLNNFSVFAINRKNKIKMDEYPDRWEQYTYRLDLAQQADKEKYGKSAK